MSDDNNIFASDGTPKSLREALRNGACVARGADFDLTLEKHVRDYLAQKFQTAFLTAQTSSEVERLERLWLLITGERRSETLDMRK